MSDDLPPSERANSTSDGSGSVQIDQGLSDAVPVFMRFFMEAASDVSASVAECVSPIKCLYPTRRMCYSSLEHLLGPYDENPATYGFAAC